MTESTVYFHDGVVVLVIEVAPNTARANPILHLATSPRKPVGALDRHHVFMLKRAFGGGVDRRDQCLQQLSMPEPNTTVKGQRQLAR